MSFEGEENLDIEFGDIVPSDCSEGSYGHISALVDRDRSSGFAFEGGHVGGSARGRREPMIFETVGGRSAKWIHRIGSSSSWKGCREAQSAIPSRIRGREKGESGDSGIVERGMIRYCGVRIWKEGYNEGLISGRVNHV